MYLCMNLQIQDVKAIYLSEFPFVLVSLVVILFCMRILYFTVVVFSKFYFGFLRCARSKRVILDCVGCDCRVACSDCRVAGVVSRDAMRVFKRVTKDGNCPFQ